MPWIERLAAGKASLSICNVTGRRCKDARIRDHRPKIREAEEEERRIRSRVQLLPLPFIPDPATLQRSIDHGDCAGVGALVENIRNALTVLEEIGARIVAVADDPVALLQDSDLRRYPKLRQYLAEFLRAHRALPPVLLILMNLMKGRLIGATLDGEVADGHGRGGPDRPPQLLRYFGSQTLLPAGEHAGVEATPT